MNKKLFALFLIASTILLFTACQKEITYTTPSAGSSTGTSVYTYVGSPNACPLAVVNGTYTVGTAITGTSNTVQPISVNVTTAGTYDIITPTVNGISFRASGTFVVGIQNISFVASGTPLAAGAFTFVPASGACSFVVNCVAAGTTPLCKSCSYVPYCTGTRLVYIDTTTTGTNTRKDTITIITDTMIDGKTFSKLITNTGGQPSYYNCNNDETRIISYNIVTTGGTHVVVGDLIMIKATAAIGTSWVNTINNNGTNIDYTSTIAEKGISRTVLGQTYSNVIHVSTVMSTTIAGVVIPLANSDYYYSKNIGLIDNITTQSGTQVQHTVLQSYFIP